MDAFKELKTEYDGIYSSIKKYTSSSDICNYLNQLKIAIDTGDQELMIYCLEKISDWYKDNLDDILSNDYVYNKDAHIKNKKNVESLCLRIKELKSVSEPVQPNTKISKINKKIFISHCSKDKKYGDALRFFLAGLGLKDEQLIYTSYPANKIPVGENIYNYLRDNITANVFVLVLMSNNYLDSVACLNEMGAAWVVKSDYLCFYTPEFDFSNPRYSQCALDTRKMGAVLKPTTNCKTSMVEFKNIVCEMFDIVVSEKTFQSLLDEFIERIKSTS